MKRQSSIESFFGAPASKRQRRGGDEQDSETAPTSSKGTEELAAEVLPDIAAQDIAAQHRLLPVAIHLFPTILEPAGKASPTAVWRYGS